MDRCYQLVKAVNLLSFLSVLNRATSSGSLMRIFLLMFLCFLWRATSGIQFNPPHLNERDNNPPSAVLPNTLNPSSVQRAFSRAEKIVASRTAMTKKLGRVIVKQDNIPSTRHQVSYSGRPKTKRMELTQEVFEETTRLLVTEFNLTSDQILSRLTAIDLKTMLQGSQVAKVEQCRREFVNPTCKPKNCYRTFDGTCNNIRNPSWGMYPSCFQRLVRPAYYDGLSGKRRARSGKELPNPRTISREIHTYLNHPSEYVTHLFMVYGQFIDHDLTQTPLSEGPNRTLINCCPIRKNDIHICDPIPVLKNDPFYDQFGISCLNNVRSSICTTCSLGPRQQINQMSSYIDASMIYGSDNKIICGLRNLDGTGTLKFSNTHPTGELPPSSRVPSEDFCSYQRPKLGCFQTGDQRANQHPALTTLHILFFREHNRIARILKQQNKNWGEETLFQEARRIVGAELQVITYNEFLPLVIGQERMEWFHLNILKSGYTQYDDTVQAMVLNEFSVAAFRFGHSMINSFFPEIGLSSSSVTELQNVFLFPFGLYDGQYDNMLRGLPQSPVQNFDRYMVRDVTNHLLQNRGNKTGLDLASININRGRDHGLQGYTALVEFCGGPRINNFEQLDELFREGYRPLFQKLYESVEDIDLFSGGLAERPEEGAIVGPTFTCIIGIQFYHVKHGDRFYFEHSGQAGSFRPEQLKELRKVNLGRIICDNSAVKQVQTNVLLRPNNRNVIRNCSELLAMDLSVWRS